MEYGIVSLHFHEGRLRQDRRVGLKGDIYRRREEVDAVESEASTGR